MKWRNDIHSLVDIVYVHPSLAEVVRGVARKAAGMLQRIAGTWNSPESITNPERFGISRITVMSSDGRRISWLFFEARARHPYLDKLRKDLDNIGRATVANSCIIEILCVNRAEYALSSVCASIATRRKSGKAQPRNRDEKAGHPRRR
jgi:hypothetical protein